MSRPLLIGVTSCFMYPDATRSTFSKKSLSYIENDMAKYLATPVSLPVLLPDIPKPQLETLCAMMDGFVMQGGVDVAPQTYGAVPLDIERWPGDAYRDEFELWILDYAYRHRKPVMAVCRGSQLANCYFGGSLHQDLETQVGAAVCHRDAAEYDKVHHQCVFEPHSYLGSIYQAEGSLLQINSVHHQGIRDLGKGLVVEARCPVDGLVEAYRYEDLSDFYLIGVQWHPEFSHTLGNQIISSQPLLEDFLKRCEQQRGS